MTEQMDLPLWETLRFAQIVPEQVNFEGLLAEVEAAISQMPESEKLRMAGEAFLRMAEVYAARSGAWIKEWEQALRDPLVEQGFFDDLVRQTMAVDLSELMEPAPPRKQRTRRETRQEGSIVAAVEKEAVLAMVDQMEAAKKEKELAHPEGSALLCTHDENVSAWIEAIAQVLESLPEGQTSFMYLCQNIEISRVEVWLGVLLGDFSIEKQGDFYNELILIRGS